MILQEERDKLNRILFKNKQKKEKPANYNDLARTLKTSRQNVYYALNNKSLPTQIKLRKWLSDQNESITTKLKIVKDKIDKLSNYGFSKTTNSCQTKVVKAKNGLKYCFMVINNYLFMYVLCDNHNSDIFEDYLIDIGVIYDLIRDGIVEKEIE